MTKSIALQRSRSKRATSRPSAVAPINKNNNERRKKKPRKAPVTSYRQQVNALHAHAELHEELPLREVMIGSCEHSFMVCMFSKKLILPEHRFAIILKNTKNVNSICSLSQLEKRLPKFGCFASPHAAIMYARDAGATEAAEYTAAYYCCDREYALPQTLAAITVARGKDLSKPANYAAFATACEPSGHDMHWIRGSITKRVSTRSSTTATRRSKQVRREQQELINELERAADTPDDDDDDSDSDTVPMPPSPSTVDAISQVIRDSMDGGSVGC